MNHGTLQPQSPYGAQRYRHSSTVSLDFFLRLD